MSTVILGMCGGYSGAKVEPFLRTCRDYYPGRIVFFSHKCYSDFESICSKYEVENIALPKCDYPAVDRFEHFKEYLDRNPTVELSLFADVRDIVFQTSPFVNESSMQGLKVFDEGIPFSDSRLNQEWYEALYGHDEYERIRDKRTICVGTTIADRANALTYLAKMNSEIRRVKTKVWGTDQAVHNHLIYSGQLPGAEIVKNGLGEVQTLGRQMRFVFDEKGRVLNSNDSVPAVLHQYDRHAFLMRHFDVSDTAMSREDAKRLKKLDRSRKASLQHLIQVTLWKRKKPKSPRLADTETSTRAEWTQ